MYAPRARYAEREEHLIMYIHATGVLLGLWSEPRKRGHVSDSRSLRANRLSFRPHVQPEYELPPRPPRFTLSHARALRKLIVREAYVVCGARSTSSRCVACACSVRWPVEIQRHIASEHFTHRPRPASGRPDLSVYFSRTSYYCVSCVT